MTIADQQIDNSHLAGSNGQALVKTSGTNYAVGWTTILNQSGVDSRINSLRPANRQLPSGGSTGQILAKVSGSSYAVQWITNWTQTTITNLINSVIPNNRRIPAGGSSGQVLKKGSNSNYDVSWQADNSGSGGGLTENQVDDRINSLRPSTRQLPAGGSSGQVLKKDSNSNYDVSWQNDSGGGSGRYSATVEVRIPPATRNSYVSSTIRAIVSGSGVITPQQYSAYVRFGRNSTTHYLLPRFDAQDAASVGHWVLYQDAHTQGTDDISVSVDGSNNLAFRARGFSGSDIYITVRSIN